MKRLLTLLALTALLCSCQPKADRAAALISQQFSAADNYTPVSTVVTKAKASIYNDATTLAEAQQALSVYNQSKTMTAQAVEAKQLMDALGTPAKGSKEYQTYQTYRQQYLEKTAEAIIYWETLKPSLNLLREANENLNPRQTIGWEVLHSYTIQSADGSTTTSTTRYIVDKDFQQILLSEPADTESYTTLREFITTSLHPVE